MRKSNSGETVWVKMEKRKSYNGEHMSYNGRQ